jgi:ubiquinone/menaquinone biosynthesis C-methylase UbiE
MKENSEATFTCPWWLLFTFDNPLRKLVQNPIKILSPFVRPADTVLDVGCGMGYFSLELAKLVGEKGKVISADLQPEMLAGLLKWAKHAGVEQRIQPHLCQSDKIGIDQPIDFVLAFWMVHEVWHREEFLREVYTLLKPGGKFLIVEPIIHVPAKDFEKTLKLVENLDFTVQGNPSVRASRAVLLVK